MIHRRLSNPEQHYGVNVNFDRTHVLLQLGDESDQVRVRLTPDEVDEIIAELQKKKKEITVNLVRSETKQP